MYELTDMTGALILGWAGIPAIGHFNEAAIDQEATTKGDFSTPGQAIKLYESLASGAGVVIVDLDPSKTASLNASLVYYTIARYYETVKGSGQIACCDECEDKEQPHIWFYCRACEKLGEVSSTMQANAAFCDPDIKDELPEDFFGAELIDGCGCIVT